MEQTTCNHCKKKSMPRNDELVKDLNTRLNRISGQINGIKNMIEENRYCGDILIQVAAVESALQNLGYIILQDHMETCVKDEINKGNDEVIKEAIDLIKKLK